MKVKLFNHKLTYIPDLKKPKKVISLQGYSFINNSGNCLCIVYGEARRDEVYNLLTNIN